jgi:hypothetical protein
MKPDMNKPTPGPWGYFVDEQNVIVTIDGSQGQPVADINRTGGNAAADARLIAAAPMMLAALQQIAASPNGRGFAQFAKYIVAIPAIEKATGKSEQAEGEE